MKRSTRGRIYDPMMIACATIGLVFIRIIWLLHQPAGGARDNQFGFLAQALLHGHLNLLAPQLGNAIYHGQRFVPYGPFPAILLIPEVALFGPDISLVPESLLLVLITAITFWKIWPLLGVTDTAIKLWLSLGTFAGTVYLSVFTDAYVDNIGDHFAQLVTVACLALALYLALLGRWPVLAGILIGFSTLTRASTSFAVVPIFLIYLHTKDMRSINKCLGIAMRMAIGLIPLIVILALYNYARFGSFIEGGYSYQKLGFQPLIELRQQGLLSLVHVPKNLYYLFVAPPLIGANTPFTGGALLSPDPWGMGIIFVSPWILGAFWARGSLAKILALGTGLIMLPILLYYGIGWVQFGYRYGLDVLPFVAALAGLACCQSRYRQWLPALVVFSVIVNLAGATWLIKFA